LPADEIIEFIDLLYSFRDLACIPLVSGIITVMDNFFENSDLEALIFWSISMGENFYDEFLNNPDNLVELLEKWGDDYSLIEIAADVYREKTGKEIPYGGHKLVNLGDFEECEYWGYNQNEIGFNLQLKFPKMWAKFKGENELSPEAMNILKAFHEYKKKHGEVYFQGFFMTFDKSGECIDDRDFSYGEPMQIIETLDGILDGLSYLLL
jgi:hypothetical protein